MKRFVSMEEISDGRLYGINDMVKADCHDCVGCSKCCHDMVSTIILYPADAYRLVCGTGRGFAGLIGREVELNVVNGMVLPNLKMRPDENCCAFLDGEGRCGIHEYRPDLCRIFPLGRYYENGDFKYFLQVGQCSHPRTKIKVGKWIDTPDYGRHREYILRWHDLLEQMEEIVSTTEDEELKKNLNLAMLNAFYMTPYREEDFYGQFAERAEKWESVMQSGER